MSEYGISVRPVLRIVTTCGDYDILDFEQVGPLAIYKSRGYYNLWTVGHIASGYAVEPRCRSKEAAAQLARDLLETDADWGFTDFAAVKKWPKDLTASISAMRKASREPT